ncbi:MAG: NAD(P)H-hydrate epimerase [Candidatus Dormibacteraeota bacterium]|nr:NAD(P)H-hydrate epimerase [Candidatus Dormibacteraeota bacterium]
MGSPVPTLSSGQAREVDRLTSERFGVPVVWLMEAAGWQVARHCRGRTFVVCGKGNNGGDGLAAARHLHRWGRLAGVACTDPAGLKGPAADEARALAALGVEVASALPAELGEGTLVVDALLGTGLSRAPEGLVAEWIERLAAEGRRVIAVDVPSGLDADTGAVPGACLTASVTVTLGLPKPGLLAGEGPARSGEVWVADIGIPNEALVAAGIEVPPHLFSMHDRVQLSGLRL